MAKTHIGSILSGNVKRVIQSFQWQSTRLLLEGNSAENMEKICNFLERNAERMRYDVYLAKGCLIFVYGATDEFGYKAVENPATAFTLPRIFRKNYCKGRKS